jgi:biotin synthase
MLRIHPYIAEAPTGDDMKMDPRILRILDKAQEGIPPSRQNCIVMLDCTSTSIEAAAMRAVADAICRRRFGNEAIILGQIGIEINACPGQCKFCSFAEGHTRLAPGVMPINDILASADSFTASGDLYALFLMTMHKFDFERLITVVLSLREQMPLWPKIVVNIGDFNREQADLLRDAGVSGAYHILRLREGVDTRLDPDIRIKTIKAIKDAGLDLYYCCEPIGPEHSSEELVEQLFLGIEYGCFQHTAMRRVYIPDSPLASQGQITELRLAQITAVVSLASLACPDTRNIAVHEPNLIGLTSGANVIYAETGANPRDTLKDTSGHRGRDVRACKTMLYEAGFEYILTASGEKKSLTNSF